MMNRSPIALGLLAALTVSARAQTPAPIAIQPDSLRAHLFAIAADSMGGRQTGELGDWKAQEWVAAQFAKAGLQPAGDGGTYFQVIPFRHIAADKLSKITTGVGDLAVGSDFLPLGLAPLPLEGVHAILAGSVGRPDRLVDSRQAAGRLLVIVVPDSIRELRAIFSGLAPIRQSAAFRASVGFAIVALDRFAPDVIPQILAGAVRTDTTLRPPPGARQGMAVTPAAARALLGTDPRTAKVGTLGPALRGGVRYTNEPLAYAARNIVAVLRGRDATLSHEFISISAHHDHVGFTDKPVDHDSVFAYNRVVRPMGADSPMRSATPEEAARVGAIRDSMTRRGPDRPDSIFNGADDDGSGTVAIVA